MRSIKKVYLLLGGNMGDREAILRSAVEELIERLLPGYLVAVSPDEAVKTSGIYETEPWGFESADKFLNQAFCCITELEPHKVLDVCLEVEKELGRQRCGERYNEKGERIYSSRVIDIDILMIDELIGDKWVTVKIDTPELVVPHPRLYEREFALKPLSELRDIDRGV